MKKVPVIKPLPTYLGQEKNFLFELSGIRLKPVV